MINHLSSLSIVKLDLQAIVVNPCDGALSCSSIRLAHKPKTLIFSSRRPSLCSSPPLSLALELWLGCKTSSTWGNLQFRSRERRQRQMMKLFDAHCHLQDPRIFDKAPQLIAATLDSGVVRFAVNGVSEKDWHLVKQLGESYPCVIPCFGLHPWFVAERTPNWLNTLKQFFESTPSAAVGEIGLDKGSHGKKVDFADQVNVFRQQLELAKELERPASIHCVHAFGDLLQIMKSLGPFPAGVILHSFLGSAEMVPEFASLGAYFSFSGFLMSMNVNKAKRMLKTVPSERILLETDAPDALPKSELGSLHLVEGDASFPKELQSQEISSAPVASASDAVTLPKEVLNHPANIHNVLIYVASLLEMTTEELAEISYHNAVRLFSYDVGS